MAAGAEPCDRVCTFVTETLLTPMVDSPDEYAAFDFSEFTEEDFAQIDVQLARKLADQPRLPIELEQSSLAPDTHQRKRESPFQMTPFQQYRRYGSLFVTDLASLAWYVACFVKEPMKLSTAMAGANYNSTTDSARRGSGR